MNLAVTLAEMGQKVGLLDADVFGKSSLKMPTQLLGIDFEISIKISRTIGASYDEHCGNASHQQRQFNDSANQLRCKMVNFSLRIFAIRVVDRPLKFQFVNGSLSRQQ